MFEKEAEEWVKKEFPLLDMEHTNLEERITEYRAYKDGAEFGYEQGIARLRYCCTCKHYMGMCYDEAEPYGICADWEIKEIEQ